MKVGVISNSDNLIPLTFALESNNIQAHIFFSKSQDVYANQRVQHFLDQIKVSYEMESIERSIYNWLLDKKLDVCFVLGYSKLIKLERLKGLSTQIFNIHFGPLPSYKGPTPIFWQLKHGCDKIGLAIHRLTEKFDEGAIVWKKELENQPHYTYKYVEQNLSSICIEGVFFILGMFNQGIPLLNLDVTKTPSYHTKPQLGDVAICWKDMGAVEICNLIRACNPWNKGALTIFNGQEVKLMDACVVEKTLSKEGEQNAGSIINTNKCLHIKCIDDKILNVSMIFMHDFYIPAYCSSEYGIKVGEKFENLNF